MSVDDHCYLDTPMSRHDLRDIIVQAAIGLQAAPDFQHISKAGGVNTNVTICDDLSYQSMRPDNAVLATRVVSFGLWTKNDAEEYGTQTMRGIMAPLKALTGADAYWVSLDSEFSMLIRRKGRLVLSQDQTTENRRWRPARNPSLIAMVDLPYAMELLGQRWNSVKNESFKQAVGH